MLRQAVTTLVMHEDASRVLMVKRSKVGAFPNSLVFPGGKIDEADASESHLDRYPDARMLPVEERTRRVAAARELGEETGLQVSELASILPISRWITPEGLPYRFDTWFYILAAPEGQEPVADGTEITELTWATPEALLERHRVGHTHLLLPTLAHITRLAEFGPAWQDWPSHPDTTLEPVLSTVTKRSGDEIIDRIPAGQGFTSTLR